MMRGMRNLQFSDGIPDFIHADWPHCRTGTIIPQIIHTPGVGEKTLVHGISGASRMLMYLQKWGMDQGSSNKAESDLDTPSFSPQPSWKVLHTLIPLVPVPTDVVGKTYLRRCTLDQKTPESVKGFEKIAETSHINPAAASCPNMTCDQQPSLQMTAFLQGKHHW